MRILEDSVTPEVVRSALITTSTCRICNTKTERRELPSGATAERAGVKKVVSYWCPECRHWEPSDEAVSDNA